MLEFWTDPDGNMSTYSFDVELATTYGINEAILIGVFQYNINHINNFTNLFFDCDLHKKECPGRHVTEITSEVIEKVFPFWEEKKVNQILDSLIEQKLLEEKTSKRQKFHQTQRFFIASDLLIYYLAYKISKLSDNELNKVGKRIKRIYDETRTEYLKRGEKEAQEIIFSRIYKKEQSIQ